MSTNKNDLVQVSNGNDLTAMARMERIYNKQKDLYLKLSEINSLLVSSNIIGLPDLEGDCLMSYICEVECVLDESLSKALLISQLLK